jgi:hypothetical protein
MQSLGRRLALPAIPTPSHRNEHALFNSANRPSLYQPIPKPRNIAWPYVMKARYYIDAAQQTAKTLRTLIQQIDNQYQSLGLPPNLQLLTNCMQRLLHSIKPGYVDEEQSKARYLDLLRMHLSSLNTNECLKLKSYLQSTQFKCSISENVIDDEFYLEYGFCNGAPHCSERVLFHTQNLFDCLDDLQRSQGVQKTNGSPITLLSAATKQELRDVLAQAAHYWPHSKQNLPDLLDIACRMGIALDLISLPTQICVTELNLYGTTARIKNEHVVIDLGIALDLQGNKNAALLNRVLRDLLEVFLIQKFTGTQTKLPDLQANDLRSVRLAIEQITETYVPTITDHSLPLKARSVWSQSHEYGQIQIKPSAGISLGHAWITPDLSLIPDTSAPSDVIGMQYMHTGFHLRPQQNTIREWPTKFLTEKENTQLYPPESTWYLTVPVTKTRLQTSALGLIKEWKANNIPYRFANMDSNTTATGCRMTVWKAVQDGLEPDALTLFNHYNQGLAVPESPTELWIRLNGLMEWIKRMAGAH